MDYEDTKTLHILKKFLKAYNWIWGPEYLLMDGKTFEGGISGEEYQKILLTAMCEHNKYADEIKDWDLEVVTLSARLHDIGKIIVTDLVLNKPDRLTTDEFETMKTHAAGGERIIDSIMAESGGEIFLLNAKLFAGSHHERWDGTGYPRGLKGAEIPLQGGMYAD
jgi:putative two-component system response regulator